MIWKTSDHKIHSRLDIIYFESPVTSAVTNLTNATSSPEDIKQMDVIGGTVNQTLNASESAGMDNTSSAGMNASSNMTGG
jgi:hypothetical protein